MEVFKPIKVIHEEQYEPVLVYFKDDEEEGKVYFVKNKFDDSITDLEKRIEKLEAGFREIELYDLVEINRTGQRCRLSLYED